MRLLVLLAAGLLLTACGGTATSYSGSATGGDGVRGNISPTVSPTVTLNQPPKA